MPSVYLLAVGIPNSAYETSSTVFCPEHEAKLAMVKIQSNIIKQRENLILSASFLLVDMLLRNSICFRCTQTRYLLALRAIDMLLSATSAAMRLMRFSPISFCRKAKHIESPQAAYRATRQRRISTSSRRVRQTTASTWVIRSKGIFQLYFSTSPSNLIIPLSTSIAPFIIAVAYTVFLRSSRTF